MRIRLSIIASCLLVHACSAMDSGSSARAVLPVYHLAIACEHTEASRQLHVSDTTMTKTVQSLINAQASLIVVNADLARHSLAYLISPNTHTYAIVINNTDAPQIIGMLSIPIAYLSALTPAPITDEIIHTTLLRMGFNDLPLVSTLPTDQTTAYLLACTRENQAVWEPLIKTAPNAPLAFTMRTLFNQTTRPDHAWNILHIGHGAAAQEDPTDAVKRIITHIGGMSAAHFKEFITYFEPLHTQIVTLVSCFSGTPDVETWLQKMLPSPRHFWLTTLSCWEGTVCLPYLDNPRQVRAFFDACTAWIREPKIAPATEDMPTRIQFSFNDPYQTELKKTVCHLTTHEPVVCQPTITNYHPAQTPAESDLVRRKLTSNAPSPLASTFLDKMALPRQWL